MRRRSYLQAGLALSTTVMVFVTGCHARPHRFAKFSVVPAPPIALPAGQLVPQGTTEQINDRLRAGFSSALRDGRHSSGDLFCKNTCTSTDLLHVTAMFSPAPPVSEDPQLPSILRLSGRGQAELVKGAFSRLLPSASPSDVISQFGLAIEEPKQIPANLSRPRVQLTLSHLLTLPGDWERLQYLSIFFVLHSQDVKFVDTNQIESVLRDIDLGKLTQTGSAEISATGSLGFGNALPGATAPPGSVSVTPKISYTEALERQLKEQLEFRSSSIDEDGRVFAIVLKSSQANRLPTILRQIMTLEYGRSEKESLVIPKYKGGEIAEISVTGRVVRKVDQLSSSDCNQQDVSFYKTEVTPMYVAIVHRVKNAKGIRTSLEDDDDVEFVTQAGVLPPITIDRVQKQLFTVEAKTKRGEDISLVLRQPGRTTGSQAGFLTFEDASRFRTALRDRFDSHPDLRKQGLAWGKDEGKLEGFKAVWTRIDGGNTAEFEDWDEVSPGALVIRTAPPQTCQR